MWTQVTEVVRENEAVVASSDVASNSPRPKSRPRPIALAACCKGGAVDGVRGVQIATSLVAQEDTSRLAADPGEKLHHWQR